MVGQITKASGTNAIELKYALSYMPATLVGVTKLDEQRDYHSTRGRLNPSLASPPSPVNSKSTSL